MTRRLALLAPLALALALPACQNTSSGPAAPSVAPIGSGASLEAKGGHHGSPSADPESFAYTHVGAITTVNVSDAYTGTFLENSNTGAGQDRSGGGLGMDDCCGTYREALVLDGTLLASIDGDGACFPLTDGVYQTSFVGSIVSSGGNGVVATYYFSALNHDGNETNYRLDAAGTVVDGTFTPTGGGTATLDLTSAVMSTEGRGKGKNGCTGADLALNVSVTIEHKACEPSEWVPNGGSCLP